MNRDSRQENLRKLEEMKQLADWHLKQCARIRESRIMTRASSTELEDKKQKLLDHLAHLNDLEELMNVNQAELVAYMYNKRIAACTSNLRMEAGC